MDREAVQAQIEHATGGLRARFPRITECHAALVQWKDGGQTRYSLHLDLRWPQHQTLVSGAAQGSPEAAIDAACHTARERLDRQEMTA